MTRRAAPGHTMWDRNGEKEEEKNGEIGAGSPSEQNIRHLMKKNETGKGRKRVSYLCYNNVVM